MRRSMVAVASMALIRLMGSARTRGYSVRAAARGEALQNEWLNSGVGLAESANASAVCVKWLKEKQP